MQTAMTPVPTDWGQKRSAGPRHSPWQPNPLQPSVIWNKHNFLLRTVILWDLIIFTYRVSRRIVSPVTRNKCSKMYHYVLGHSHFVTKQSLHNEWPPWFGRIHQKSYQKHNLWRWRSFFVEQIRSHHSHPSDFGLDVFVLGFPSSDTLLSKLSDWFAHLRQGWAHQRKRWADYGQWRKLKNGSLWDF